MKYRFNRLIRRAAGKSLRTLDRMFTVQQRVAFIHIPKCAGKSVAAAIDNAMGSLLEPWINSRHARLAVNSVLPENVKSENVKATALYRNYLLAYFLHSGRKLIYGHLPVNRQLVAEFSQEAAFVTVLRDPVARWKSNYIYDRINNQDPSALPCRNSGCDLEKELDDLLQSDRALQLAYVPTMMLTGKFPASRSEAETLSQVMIETLKDFAVVGFTDDLPAFVSSFERTIGVKIDVPRKNITASQATDENGALYKTLSALLDRPAVIRKIEKLCAVERKTFQVLEKTYR